LRNALEELRAAPHPALAIAAEATAADGGFSVHAAVANDPGGIVRETRVFVRPRGESEWRTSAAGELAVQSVASEVSYYAIAIGPGGAIVARHGAEGAPLVFRTAPPIATPPPRQTPVLVPGDDGGGVSAGVIVSIVAGAAVA